jgi:serine/threonine-protein phosphatase 2B catalytic subunit
MPNASYLKEHFFNEGRILEQHALWILQTASDILRREPNMVLVESPMTSAFVSFLHVLELRVLIIDWG